MTVLCVVVSAFDEILIGTEVHGAVVLRSGLVAGQRGETR